MQIEIPRLDTWPFFVPRLDSNAEPEGTVEPEGDVLTIPEVEGRTRPATVIA